jgi:hypothetical protein
MRPWMLHHEAATSVIAYAEAAEYVKGLPNPSNRMAALRTLLREIHPYFLTYSILERYADLRRQLRRPQAPGSSATWTR